MTDRGRFYLKEWRELRDLSQEELAEMSGVNQGTISGIETDPHRKRRPVTLDALAKALRIERTDLRTNPRKDAEGKPPTPKVVLDNLERFLLHGDLSSEQVIEVLATIQAERRKRGMDK